MADFATTTAYLSSAVATSGTFTSGYPTGFTAADFSMGSAHKLVIGGKTYSAPVDFTVAFTSLTVITYTWKAANTLPAGSNVRVQLDSPTQGAATAVPGVNRAHYTSAAYFNLGNPVATSASSLRAAAAVGGAGALTLITAGKTFDVPRNVIITSAGNDTGITFAVVGTDEYGVAVNETITGANAGVAAGKKAFKTITSITASGAAAGNVSVGIGNVLGLPLWVPHAGCILAEFQDGANPTAGTFVGGLAALTAATATTADVRGTYVPNSAPDGAKAYGLIVAVPDATFKGVTQF